MPHSNLLILIYWFNFLPIYFPIPHASGICFPQKHLLSVTSRVMQLDFLSERAHINMRVDLCSGNLFMPEKCLDNSQICSSFKQGRCKTMP